MSRIGIGVILGVVTIVLVIVGVILLVVVITVVTVVGKGELGVEVMYKYYYI